MTTVNPVSSGVENSCSSGGYTIDWQWYPYTNPHTCYCSDPKVEVALSALADEERWVNDHFEPLFLVRMLKDGSTIKLTLDEVAALGFKVVSFDTPKEEPVTKETVVTLEFDLPNYLRALADQIEKEQE